jgi:hypothetical protein
MSYYSVFNLGNGAVLNTSISTLANELTGSSTNQINFGGRYIGPLLAGGARALTGDTSITNISISKLKGKGTDYWVPTTVSNTYTALAPNDNLSYASGNHTVGYVTNDVSRWYHSYSYRVFAPGKTSVDYIGWNQDPANILWDDPYVTIAGSGIASRYEADYWVNDTNISKLPFKIYQIPPNCTTVVIQAWGGGGGSGGSWNDSYGGYGGAGGYATTTLTVNSTVNPATGRTVRVGDLLYCWIGLGGGGATDLWSAGVGGMGSAVWLLSGPSYGAVGYPKTTGGKSLYGNSAWSEWHGARVGGGIITTGLTEKFFREVFGGEGYANQTNLAKDICVLIAGGGGGGGTVNWGGGLSAGSGGSGGSDGASAPLISASGTGATTTAHGLGVITASGSVTSVEQAGRWSNTNQNNIRNTSDVPEATIIALFPEINIGHDSQASAGLSTYAASGGGGGGAFRGNIGPRITSDQGTNTRGRGGGGGANKVYFGSGSTSSSGVSNSPPNNDGTHGIGGTPRYAVRDSYYWRGGPGRAGKVVIQFISI